MNCAQLRDLLPGRLYGHLAPEDTIAVDQHLAACPGCREEQAALAEVRRLLDLAPLPDVRTHVPGILGEAWRRQRQSARRWRRIAGLALGTAALLGIVVGLNLEVRWENRQLVLRIGQTPSAPLPAPPLLAQRPPAPLPSPEVTAADLQLVKDLVRALAASAEERDGKVQEQLNRVAFQLGDIEEQARQRWAATERYVSALHTAQMESHTKGER
jgi:hypothetical protein